MGELAELLKDSQPQVSRKAAPLRDAGLLDARRDGTRTWLHLRPQLANDSVVADALSLGRTYCLDDGSLARLPGVVARREDKGRSHFEDAPPAAELPATPSHLAHLLALAPLIPSRALAVDVGAGDGLLLDVLAPLFTRVIAVDRSRAQLARLSDRVASRGFHNVSLFAGEYDDGALLQRVDSAGGADVVFAGRTLHHASRPASAVESFARLLRKGGHLVVLDYLRHDDEQMRTAHGDVWLGFPVDDVRGFCTSAGLQLVTDLPIPPMFHAHGPDAALTWHAWVARKASPPVVS